MSFSTLKQLLTRSLSLTKFLTSSPSLTPFGLINRFFAFLSSLRRWLHTSDLVPKPALRQRQGSTASAAAQGDGVIYPMNVPSPGLSDPLQGGWRSHTDLPYSDRSRSGGHLIPPTPARRYSRDAPWTPSDEIPIQDEPDSIIHNTSRAVHTPEMDSSTNAHNLQDSHTPSSDLHTHPFPLPSPHHRTFELTTETSSLSSRSPSRLSGSRRSRISTRSGQSLYREYHGPPAHFHIPTPIQDVSVLGSSSSARTPRGELSDVMAFENTTGTPNADAGTQGGQFFPMSASGVLRYERGRTRPPSECDQMIKAMWLEYPKMLQYGVPEGWTARRHPEGALYFVHNETKTFTEVDIREPDALEDIEYFSTFLRSELRAEIKKLSRDLAESLDISEVQLVLEPMDDKLGVMCCYYFVNPQTRSLFWLDDWEAVEILGDCRGILSTSHKGLAIQAHYWSVDHMDMTHRQSEAIFRRHWSFYPDFCEVTEDLKEEVANKILHGICDHLTSNKPTSPLSAKELDVHLSLIKDIHPDKPDKDGHFAIIIGRIMSEFYHFHFVHFHGEDCARLDPGQTIYGWQYQPSLLMTTVAPLLFMTPVHIVRRLHKIYVDEILNGESWNKFVVKLYTELHETSVLASVLLNVNVSFLQKLGTAPSLQQFLTCTSLVTSMASIILSLVFMGHSLSEAKTNPSEVAKFLSGLWHEKHGFENLAIIYSLPQCFLMWGMILFFVAFSIQWFYPDHMTWRAGAGAFMLLAMLLLACCIRTTRDKSHYWWFQPDPLAKVARSEEVEGEGRDSVTSFCNDGIGHLLRRLTLAFRPSADPQAGYPEQVTLAEIPVVQVSNPLNSSSQPNSHAS